MQCLFTPLVTKTLTTASQTVLMDGFSHYGALTAEEMPGEVGNVPDEAVKAVHFIKYKPNNTCKSLFYVRQWAPKSSSFHFQNEV